MIIGLNITYLQLVTRLVTSCRQVKEQCLWNNVNVYVDKFMEQWHSD